MELNVSRAAQEYIGNYVATSEKKEKEGAGWGECGESILRGAILIPLDSAALLIHVTQLFLAVLAKAVLLIPRGATFLLSSFDTVKGWNTSLNDLNTSIPVLETAKNLVMAIGAVAGDILMAIVKPDVNNEWHKMLGFVANGGDHGGEPLLGVLDEQEGEEPGKDKPSSSEAPGASAAGSSAGGPGKAAGEASPDMGASIDDLRDDLGDLELGGAGAAAAAAAAAPAASAAASAASPAKKPAAEPAASPAKASTPAPKAPAPKAATPGPVGSGARAS